MDPFEKAIRSAFEKSDPSDLAVRRRVYRSALNALERAIEGNANVTDAQAQARRTKLKTLIKSIESEFAMAAPAIHPSPMSRPQASSPAPSVQIDSPVTHQVQPVAGSDRAKPQFEEAVQSSPDAGQDHSAPEPGLAARLRTRNLRNEGKKKRWPKFVFNLVILLLLVFAVVYAIRWVLNTDLRQFASSNNSNENLEFTSRSVGTAQDQNWITIFDPEDVSTVRVGNGAEARLSADGRSNYLQIASPSSNSIIVFDVGPGILNEFEGKKALIAIRAKTVSDEKSDMAVSCDFGTLGKCSRKRFTVTSEVQDFIFDHDFTGQSPNASGLIEIVSDIEGSGKPLNLVAIQIRERTGP